ncbi:MAG: hypothetical protein WC307_02180 [Candidatus Nanoarchaeia archaeon]|jgi:hypothetical protein
MKNNILITGLVYSLLLTVLITHNVLFNPGLPLYNDLVFQFDKDIINNYYFYSWNPISNYPSGGDLPQSLIWRVIAAIPLPLEFLTKCLYISVYFLISFSSYLLLIKLSGKLKQNQKIIVALSGSLVYTLNHWVYTTSLGYFAILLGYSIAPLICLTLIKSFENKRYSPVVSLLLLIVSFDPRNLIYTSLCMLPIILIDKHKFKDKILTMIIILVCFVPLISYFVLPGLNTTIYHLPFSQSEFLSSNSNIANSIRLYGFFVGSYLKGATDSNPITYLLSFIVPFASFCAIAIKKDKSIKSFTLLALLVLLLSQGTFGPLRLIYSNLNKIPILGSWAWLIREPDKINFVLSFCYAFLFSQFISGLLEINNKLRKYKKIIISIVLVSIIVVNCPLLSGYFKLNQGEVKAVSIPNSYYDINDYFKNDTQKALWLPFSYGQLVFDWANNTIPIFPMYFNTIYQDNYNDLNFKFIMSLYFDILNSNDASELKKLFSALGIKYILLHNDFMLVGDFFDDKEYINKSIFKSYENKSFSDDVTLYINDNVSQIKINEHKNLVIGSLDSYQELLNHNFLDKNDLIFFGEQEDGVINQFLDNYSDGDKIIFCNKSYNDLLFGLLNSRVSFSDEINRIINNDALYLLRIVQENKPQFIQDMSFDSIYRFMLNDLDIVTLLTYSKGYYTINNSKFDICLNEEGLYELLIRYVDGPNYDGFSISINNTIKEVKTSSIKDEFKIVNYTINLSSNNNCISIDSQGKNNIINDIKLVDYNEYELTYEEMISELSNKTIIMFDENATYENKDNNVDITNFIRINPSEMILNITIDSPFYLTLTETFDKNWVATIGNESFNSIKTNYFMNSFYINKTGELSIRIYHKNQDNIGLGRLITNISLIIIVIYLMILQLVKFIRKLIIKEKK